MSDFLAVHLEYAVRVWLVGINRTNVKRSVLVATMATSTMQSRLASIVKLVNEVAHQWERVLIAMLVNFKVEKAKQCVMSAAMATSTKQDRPALSVQWVNEVDHHWERALSVKKRPTQPKQDEKRARNVTLDKHPTQPKQPVKDHRTNNPPIALRIFNF